MMTGASAVLTYALHSFVVGAVALCVERLLRRHPLLLTTLWKVALIAPLLTTGFVLVSGGSGTVGLASAIGRVVPVAPAMVEVDVREINGMPPRRTERVRDPVGWSIALLCTLLVIAGLVRGTLLVRRRRSFLQRMNRLKPFEHPVLHDVRAVETHLVAIPVALASGIVALPLGFMTCGSERSRNAILMHELAHIHRRDPGWVDLARLIATITPWQPLNRLIAARLERDVELAADAAALTMGAEAAGLIEGLVWFTTRALSPSPMGAALVRAESPVVRRAERLLRGQVPGPRRPIVFLAALTIVLTASAMTMLPALAAGFTHGTPGAGTEVVEVDIRGKQPGR
jgi:beta-lactamase regulating signal transducer with metallopeptidase domain